MDTVAESALKDFALKLQADPEVVNNPGWNISIRAEGHTLRWSYQHKQPLNEAELAEVDAFVGQYQKKVLAGHCSESNDYVLDLLNGIETHTFYSPEGKRLTSFSITPADCRQW
jgi:hypothetical protein